MDIAMGVLAGQDLWDGSGSAGTLKGYENDKAIVHCMHVAAKRIVQSIAHSIAMNGLTSSATIIPIESWWIVVLKVITFANFGIAAAGIAMMILEHFLVKETQVAGN